MATLFFDGIRNLNNPLSWWTNSDFTGTHALPTNTDNAYIGPTVTAVNSGAYTIPGICTVQGTLINNGTLTVNTYGFYVVGTFTNNGTLIPLTDAGFYLYDPAAVFNNNGILSGGRGYNWYFSLQGTVTNHGSISANDLNINSASCVNYGNWYLNPNYGGTIAATDNSFTFTTPGLFTNKSGGLLSASFIHYNNYNPPIISNEAGGKIVIFNNAVTGVGTIYPTYYASTGGSSNIFGGAIISGFF